MWLMPNVSMPSGTETSMQTSPMKPQVMPLAIWWPNCFAGPLRLPPRITQLANTSVADDKSRRGNGTRPTPVPPLAPANSQQRNRPRIDKPDRSRPRAFEIIGSSSPG